MPSYKSLLVLVLAAYAMTPVLAAEAATQPLKKTEGRFSSHLVQRELKRQEPPRPAEPPAEAPKPAEPQVEAPKPAAPPVEAPKPAAEAAVAKTGSKMGWKMKTLIGTSLAVNALFGYSLFSNYEGNKAYNQQQQAAQQQAQQQAAQQQAAQQQAAQQQAAQQQAAAAPPGSAPQSSSAAGGTPQQNYGQNYGYPQNAYPSTYSTQQTSPPSTNNGPNARREERPLRRRKFGRRSPVDFPKARSFSDNVRRTTSHPDLLSRADFEEALSLFGRMLDRLD